MKVKNPIYLMCHGDAEKIFLEKLLNKYNWNNDDFMIPIAISPDGVMNISSTQTTNVFENLEKALLRHKEDFISYVSLFCKIGVIIYLDINEKDENSDNLEILKTEKLKKKLIDMLRKNEMEISSDQIGVKFLYNNGGIEKVLSEILYEEIEKENNNKHIYRASNILSVESISERKLEGSNLNEIKKFVDTFK